MNMAQHNPAGTEVALCCEAAQASFSDYLDGSVSGTAMAAIAEHLDVCPACSTEFAELRDVQRAVANVGAAQPPARLQAMLRQALAQERERGTHLGLRQKMMLFCQRRLAPVALRVSGGLAVAVLLAVGISSLFAAPIAANDDRMAHLVSPRYLYSMVPPQPIVTPHDAPIMVDAHVDDRGRVYDFTILEGQPAGAVGQALRIRVEENLLASVFKPATVFGVPVRGHVLITYSGVSVRG